MAQKIHYEDNLFFLNLLVKTLRDGMTLDIDHDLFLDKVIEDIFFVDSLLVRLYASVRENIHMLRRIEYLRTISRAKKGFSDFLDAVLREELPFAASLGAFFPKLRSSRDEHLRDVMDIQSFLVSERLEPPDEEEIISQEEYRFLLHDDQDVPDHE